jgi:hypothetical protein
LFSCGGAVGVVAAGGVAFSDAGLLVGGAGRRGVCVDDLADGRGDGLRGGVGRRKREKTKQA